MKTYTYFGITIYYHHVLSHSLPYSAYINGSFIYADTLAGIKRIIRAAVK